MSIAKIQLPKSLKAAIFPSGLTSMSRPTYLLELAAAFFSSLGLSVGVNAFCSYLARENFSASSNMVAAIISAGALGAMATSLLSSQFSGLRQSTVAAAGRWAGAAMLIGIALLNPQNSSAAIIFTTLALLTATCVMLSTHAITQIWKANYPTTARGAIVSRVLILQLALTAILARLAGKLIDIHPNSFKWLFISAAAGWVIAGWHYYKIPVRGDHKRINDSAKLSRNPFTSLGVLITDKQFARYQSLQMFQGMACLSMGPIWTLALSDLFNLSYANAAGVLMTIPFTMQVLLVPFLGKLFDRISLFRFRWFGSLSWGSSFALMAIACEMRSMPMVICSFIVMGIAQSFGRLAWSMGHMDFGQPSKNLTYMSAHMMLTGVRGITMPFIGTYLYTYTTLGTSVYWIAAAMLLATAITFRLWDPHKGRKAAIAA